MLIPVGFYHDPAGPSATLTLNALNSIDFDISSPYFSSVGVRVNTNGDVQELSSAGSWVLQNSGVEWIDDAGATASDYECRLTGSGTIVPSNLNTWLTIDSIRTFQDTITSAGVFSFTGTLEIREIANTSNSVSAAVTMSINNEPL